MATTTFFDLLILMGCLAYLRAIHTPPGAPPVKPLQDPGRAPLDQVHACILCNNYKPERTHHCTICNRCVLRMDHHCPWIINCVGFFNFKYFLLLSFYISTAGILYLFCMGYTIFFHPKRRRIISGLPYVGYMLVGVLFVPVVISMNFIMLQNLLNIYAEVTTVERARGIQSYNACVCFDRHQATGEYNPYDLGWLRNFEGMLGKCFLSWFMPVTDYKDNGYDYKSIPGPSLQYGISSEPQHNEVVLKPGKRRVLIGATPDDYLIDVQDKYKVEELAYEDLLALNNIKAL